MISATLSYIALKLESLQERDSGIFRDFRYAILHSIETWLEAENYSMI